MIWFAAATQFIKSSMPLIKKIAPYLAIFALLGCVWLHGNRVGKAKWKTRAEVAESALNRAERGWESSRKAVAICNEQTLAAAAEASARQARLEKELDRKPDVLVKYVDRVETIETTITSGDCVVALSQAAMVLNGVEAP